LTELATTPKFDLYLSEVFVRSIARSCGRSYLAAMLGFGLLNLPVLGATGEPLGVVIQTQDAHLSNANAQIGATVYPGDAITTEQDGTIRLRVGSGQLYFAPSSSASLTQISKIAHISLSRGTAGFVSVTASQLELETPVGLVRPANGQRAQGQVTVTGPNQMMVSAYSGALAVERDGESHIVEAGKSYNVTFDPNAALPAQGPAGAGTGQTGSGNNNGSNGNNGGTPGTSNNNKGQLLFDAILLGGAAGAGAIIWHYTTQSSTSPSN
jgi:hypothetical protein